MTTQYQNDDYEHNFGRWRVVNNGSVVTRYFARAHADDHVDRLRRKCYGRGAKVEDGGEAWRESRASAEVTHEWDRLPF